jgi:hypothetical protein
MNRPILFLPLGFLLALALRVTDVNARPVEYGLLPYDPAQFVYPESNRLAYLQRFPVRPLQLHSTRDLRRQGQPARDEDGQVLLVVNHTLFRTHQQRFETYAADMNGQGYDVTLLDLEGGTAAELKSLLLRTGGESTAGIVFAGELPLAWFEQLEYFDDPDQPDNPRLQEYPIDLFFMDWDGEWLDTSGNGIYDVHQGSVAPDVWLGRIAAYNLSRLDEDSLVAAYLDRNHSYRQGELSLPHEALTYIDDDWADASREWTGELAMAYGMVTTVADPETTSATGYRRHIIDPGYEYVQVAVHSTTDTHSFLINHRREYDYFRFTHLRDQVTPNVFFYNLFACSAMNLDRNLCMGSLYSLKPPYGLGAVGSSKVGGMLFFEDYYSRLAEGLSFGQALKEWLTLHMREPGMERWAQSWFYGMTHFGDPTLHLPRGLRSLEYAIDDRSGDGDGVLDVGETVGLTFFIANQSALPIPGSVGQIFTDDPNVEVIESRLQIGDLAAGDIIEASGPVIRLADEIPDRHRVPLLLQMTPGEGTPWWDRKNIEVRSPVMNAISFQTNPEEGDDGFVSPGETGSLQIRLMNAGGQGLLDSGSVTLEALGGGFELFDATVRLPAVDPGRNAVTTTARYRVSPDHPDGDVLFLRLLTSSGYGLVGRSVIAIPVSIGSGLNADFDADPVWLEKVTPVEDYTNAWRWSESGGEGSGGLCYGGPDTLFYPGHSDGCLELPLMLVDDDAEMTIRHKMDAEEEYDGGVVEVKRDGEWVRATPVGGYGGRSVNNGSFPGGPAWNGAFDWREDRIRIGGPAGSLRVRLRFASDEGVEASGWRIDRISITGTPLLTELSAPLPDFPWLIEAFPNPFNNTVRLNTSGAAGAIVEIYTLDGRLMRFIGTIPVTGKFTATIDGTGLAAGVYLVRMSSLDRRLTQKLVLVK